MALSTAIRFGTSYSLRTGTATRAPVLDKHIQEFANYPDVQQEIMISILVHVLNKLVKAPEAKEVVPSGAGTAKEVS
jgi:hypothetical protein